MTNASHTIPYQPLIRASDYFIASTSFICLVFGFIGNTLNIIIFGCLKVFRGNPSAFYLIAEAIVDYFVLLNIFVSRIFLYGYNINFQTRSVYICKIQAAILQISIMASLSTVCFSAIDQYLVTSHKTTYRQMSSVKLSQRLTILNIVVWSLHSIPFAVFYEITSSNACDIVNKVFRLYFSVVYLALLNGAIPLVVSCAFSALAYRNVRHLVRRQVPHIRRRLDKQMTAIILTRVAFLLAVSIPFGIYLVYEINLSNQSTDAASAASAAINQLVYSITSFLFYVNYAGPFYLFLITSRRFRGQAKHALGKKFWRKYFCKTRNDTVVPFNITHQISHASSHD